MTFRARTTRLVFAAAATTALLAVTSACSSAGSPGGGTAAPTEGSGIPDGPINVGLIVPLSGPLAGWGEGINGAIETFVDEVNEAGGIDGHDLNLIVVNDGNDPAKGVAGAQELAAQDVRAVFFAGLGGVYPQTLPVLMKEKILVIDNQSQDRFSYDPAAFPYHFSTQGTSTFDANVMLGFAESQGVKTIGIISDGLPYGEDIKAAVEKLAPDYGIEVTTTVAIQPAAPDVTTQIAQLKEAGVDAIYTTTSTSQAAQYNAVRQLGWDPLILGNSGTSLTGAADATENTVFPCLGPLEEGAEPDDGVLDAIDLVDAAGVQGIQPNVAPIYRDVVQLFVAVVTESDSVDPDVLKETMETFEEVSPTAPAYRYTYTADSHAGWAGETGACYLEPRSPEGLFYLAAD
jgi:branched-chain amino acid transport system substrate-binding protein